MGIAKSGSKVILLSTTVTDRWMYATCDPLEKFDPLEICR